MRRVALLRARSGSDDPYERAIREAGCEASSVPVLAYEFANEVGLQAALSEGRFGALALTSPRAVEAIERAGLPGAWTGRVAWTVGEETGRRAALLGLHVRGQDSGTADVLAQRIAAAEPARPVLFVAGDRRRDALPTGLRARGVAFEEVEAYRTHLRPPPLLVGPAPDVLGFFSPSGVEAAQADPGFPWAVLRIAIGPTTAEALRVAGHPADAVATAPTPAALADAALRATGRPSRGG